MLKIIFITNDPAPYRLPIFNRIAKMPEVSLHVIFSCKREPNRFWTLPPLNFEHTFLRENFITVKGRYIHNNIDVIHTLRKINADVIVTDGFNPTHLYAFCYAMVKRAAHVAMTDGTFNSEKTLSAVHKFVRKIVFAKSDAFIWASLGGEKLYASYGISEKRCFRSCLCVDNEAFSAEPEPKHKQFDLIFCGRIEPVKNPIFAINVALKVAEALNRKVKIIFVGTGSQEQDVKNAALLRPDLLEAEFNGFAAQSELPSLYRSAKLFIFPTLWDPWGVVANEACAAGLPILVSPHAGVADELVLDGENGFVCDLDIYAWTERIIMLLTQPDLYKKFSDRSRSLVSNYTFDNASLGLVNACNFAASTRHPQP